MSGNRRGRQGELAWLWILCVSLGVGLAGCAGGLQEVRPLTRDTVQLKQAGIYELRAKRPKGASCALYQDGQPILLDTSRNKKAGICSLKHFFGAGTYQLKIKRPKPKKKKASRRSRLRRRFRRYVRAKLRKKRPKPRTPSTAKAKQPKPTPQGPDRWLLAYKPHQLGAGGTLSGTFARRKAPTAGAAPFVPLQSALLQVSQPGLYRLEGTGVTGTMQLYHPKGALVAESRGGHRGEDCLLHAYLKPGRYPLLLTSKRPGPFALRTRRVETKPLAPGQVDKGQLPRRPGSVGYQIKLKKRTLLQLAIEAQGPMTCDLFDDLGRLLSRFRGRKGCKTARPLSAGEYALRLHAASPTDYAAQLKSFSTQPITVGQYQVAPLQKDKPMFFRFEAKRTGDYVILTQTQSKPRYAVYDASYRLVHKVIKTRSYFHMTRYRLRAGTHYLRMLPTQKATEESAFVVLDGAKLTDLSQSRRRSRYVYRNHAFQFYRLKTARQRSYSFDIFGYPSSYSLRKYTRMGCGILDHNLKALATGRVVGRRCTAKTRLRPGSYFAYTILRILLPKRKPKRGRRAIRRRRSRLNRGRKRLVRTALASKGSRLARRPLPPRKANGTGAEAKGPTLRKLPLYRYRLSMYTRSHEEHSLQLSSGVNLTYKTTRLTPKSRILFRFYNKQSGLYLFETSGKGIDPSCALRSNQLVGKQWTYIKTLTYDNNGGEEQNCRILAQLDAGYYTYQVKSYYGSKASGRLTATLKRLNPKSQPLLLGVPTPARKVRPNAPHMYALQVKRAAFYQLLTAGHSDPNCAIYNERFHLVGAHSDNVPGQNLNCSVAVYLYPGRYTLMVSLGNRYFAQRSYRVLWRPYQFDAERRLQPGRPFVAGPLQVASPHIYLLEIEKDGFYKVETSGPSDPSCRLYNSTAEQLAFNRYIHYSKNPNCRIIRHLQRGKYMLRVQLYRAKYRGRPYELNVTPYPMRTLRLNVPDRIATLKGRAPLFYRLKLPKDGLYRIYTQSGPFTSCVLYRGASKRVASHGWYGCSIIRHLRRGDYTLRVKFSSYRAIKGGLVARASSLSPQEFSPGRGLTLPALSASTPTLLKLRVPRDGFYQLGATGRARCRCELFQPPFKKIAATPYGNYKCGLAQRLKRGEYYLRVRPYYRYDAGKAIRLSAAKVKPQTIALQKRTRVQIARMSQSFFYKVKIPTAGFYHFGSFGQMARCHLFDTTKSKAIASAYQRNCSITKGLNPGTYLFQVLPRVYSYYFKRGKRLTLDVTVRTLPPQRLAAGASTKGRVLLRGRPHFYQFKAPRSGMYTFVTTGNSDPQASLYNSFYEPIGLARDTYTQASRRKGSGLGYRVSSRRLKRSSYNFSLMAYLKKGRSYYLKVSAQRSWRTRNKRYQLRVKATRSLISDLSINRALTAAPLGYGVPHFYRLLITKPGLYEIETSGRSDPNCSLYAASSKHVASHKNIYYKWRSRKNNLNCRITRKLAAGEYVVKVALGNTQYAGRPYTVEVERVEKKRRTRIVQTSRPDDTRRSTSADTSGNRDASDPGDAKENLDKELSKDN